MTESTELNFHPVNNIIEESGVTAKANQEPRPYQDSIFRKALKENVIAFLETGTGKTLIACLLAKEFAKPLDNINASVYEQLASQRRCGLITQDNLIESLPILNKKVVFLVPKTPLVKQQAIQLRNNAELVVKEYQGNIEHFQTKDIEDAALWHREWSQAQALVMTPQILLNLLKVRFICMSNISLLIFDEAHHANGDHTYVHIMRDYYKTANEQPRIFGMTASPLNSKSNSEIKVNQNILELQDTLMSKIVTVDPELIDQYVPRCNTILMFYQRQHFMYNLSDISHFMRNPSTITNIKDSVVYDYMYYRYLINSHHPKKDSIIRDGDYIKEELGVYLASKWFYTHHNTNWSKKDDSLFPIQGATPLNKSDPILHFSNKLNTLVVNLNTLYNTSSVRSLIFTDRKCIVFILSAFLVELAKSDIIPLSCIPWYLEAGLSESNKSRCISNFNNGSINLLITTSVAEEGLDISACSVVHMLSCPKSSKSLIQTRGRARHLKSDYILFIEQGDAKELRELANRTAEEYYQSGMIRNIKYCKNDVEYTKYYNNSISISDVEDPVFKVNHAICNQYDALSKLVLYARKQTTNSDPFTFTLILVPGRMSMKRMQKYLFIRKIQATRIRENAPAEYPVDLQIPPTWQVDKINRDDTLDNAYIECEDEHGHLYQPFQEYRPPTCSDTVVNYMYAYQLTCNFKSHLNNEFIVGPPRHKLKEAKQACSLMAIKRLYNTGGFDQLLLPIGSLQNGNDKLHKLLNSEKFKQQPSLPSIQQPIITVGVDYGVDEDGLVMNHDTCREYKRMTSLAFRARPIPTDCIITLYPIAVTLAKEANYLNDGGKHSFCFLSHQSFKTCLPDSVIWLNLQTPCRVGYTTLPPLHLTANEFKEIEQFQSHYYKTCGRLLHHMDLIKRQLLIKQNTYKMTQDMIQQINQLNFMNEVDCWVLPLIATTTPLLSSHPDNIPFQCKDMQRLQNYQIDYITSPLPCVDWKIDYQMMQQLNDSYIPAADVVPMDALLDLPITSMNRSYFVESIHTNKSIHDVMLNSKYTFYAYYKSKHNIILQEGGAFVKTKNSYTLSSHEHYHPHGTPNATSSHTDAIYLPLQVCYILPMSKAWLKLANIIPSIFYKLEHITRAIDITNELHINIDNANQLNRLVQAMIHPESLEIMNYERLEFLGDSFLKYAVGLDLFLSNPTWNEGQLSIKRDSLIRNSFLCEIAKQHLLPNRVYMKHMDPQLFCIKEIHCELMTKCHDVDIKINSSYERFDGIRMMSNKNVADLVESIIGAVYCINGEKGAFQVLIELGICSDTVLSHCAIPKSICTTSTPMINHSIHYTFQQPLLLQQSQCINTLEFDRLEYLGDGVLDFCCALYSYINYPMDLPGKLTQFKQSLVQNVAFSATCFKLRLFTSIKLNNQQQYKDFFDALQQIESWDIQAFNKTTSLFNGYKVLGDVFESYCGALYMDNNRDIQGLWDVMGSHITEILIDESRSNISQEMLLQQYLLQVGISFKQCRVYPELLNGIYKCTVYIDNKVMGVGMDGDLDKATIVASWDVLGKVADGKTMYAFKMQSTRESVKKKIFDEACMSYLAYMP